MENIQSSEDWNSFGNRESIEKCADGVKEANGWCRVTLALALTYSGEGKLLSRIRH
jgi:hypothetical protein